AGARRVDDHTNGRHAHHAVSHQADAHPGELPVRQGRLSFAVRPRVQGREDPRVLARVPGPHGLPRRRDRRHHQAARVPQAWRAPHHGRDHAGQRRAGPRGLSRAAGGLPGPLAPGGTTATSLEALVPLLDDGRHAVDESGPDLILLDRVGRRVAGRVYDAVMPSSLPTSWRSLDAKPDVRDGFVAELRKECGEGHRLAAREAECFAECADAIAPSSRSITTSGRWSTSRGYARGQRSTRAGPLSRLSVAGQRYSKRCVSIRNDTTLVRRDFPTLGGLSREPAPPNRLQAVDYQAT